MKQHFQNVGCERVALSVILIATFIVCLIWTLGAAGTHITQPETLRVRHLPSPTKTSVRMVLGGDLMLGRAFDQVLPGKTHNSPIEPYPCTPVKKKMYDCLQSSLDYIDLAINKNGRFPFECSTGGGDNYNHTVNNCIAPSFDYPWGDLLKDMDAKQPDARLFLLETAVTDQYTPYSPDHKVYHFRMDPSNIPVLHSGEADVLFIANNHVLDYSRPGLLDTLSHLHDNGFQTAGAGLSFTDAYKPAIVQVDSNTRILSWAVATHNSGVYPDWHANETASGIAGIEAPTLDVADRLAAVIETYRQPGDVVVLSIHWGNNYQTAPAEAHIDFAHHLIDLDAVDVIAGSSSHHLMGGEVYKGKLVIYGMGDLINDTEGRCKRDARTGACRTVDVRSDQGAAWFVDVDRNTGDLEELIIKPTKIKHLRITHPSTEELMWAKEVIGGNFTAQCLDSGYYCGLKQLPNDDFQLEFHEL